MADRDPLSDLLDEEILRREQSAYAAANAPTTEERTFATVKEAADFVGNTGKADMKRAPDGTWKVKRITEVKEPTIPKVDPVGFARETAAKLLEAHPDTPDEDLVAIKAWADRRVELNKVRAETAEVGPAPLKIPAWATGMAAAAKAGNEAMFGVPEAIARGALKVAGKGDGAASMEDVGRFVDEGRKTSPVAAALGEGLGGTAGAMALVKPVANMGAAGLARLGLSEGAAATVAGAVAGGAHGAAATGTLKGGVNTALFMGGTAGLSSLFRGSYPGVARYLAAEAGAGGTASLLSQFATTGEVDPARALADAVVNTIFGIGGARGARARIEADLKSGMELKDALDRVRVDMEKGGRVDIPAAESMTPGVDAPEVGPRVLEVPEVITTTKSGPPAPRVVEDVTRQAESAAKADAAIRAFEERTGLKTAPEPIPTEKPVSVAPKAPAEAPRATTTAAEAGPATADVATATPDVAAPKARGVGYTRGADPVTDPVSAMVEAVKTGGARIGDWFQRARDVAVGLSRRALPRMTAANPEASAAASAKAASPVAARATADRIVSEVVRPGTVGDLELGAALTEANLRDVRRGYEEAGDAAGAARVRSIIGAEGSPFKTEAEYRAFLDKPEVKAAIDRHKALFEANVESLYKESVGIPEAEALPVRGSEAYGARINLKRVSPEEQPGPGQVRFYDVSANPGNVRNRRNPFSRRATGASEAYDLLYSRIIENSLSRQYETATWKRTQKALLDGGDAVLVKPGEKPPTDIKGRTPYRLVEGRLNEGTLYVRSDLAGELTRVAKINPDTPLTGRVLKPVNIAALTGPADAITNIVNVVGGTMVYPSGEGGAVAQAALKASPLHVPVAIGRVIKTALEPAAKQAAEIQTLAEVGAARIYEAVNWKNPSQWLKGVANAVDRAGRVIMLRAYRARVARGEHAFDAAQLRDWVNLLGNYTSRLQGPVMRMLSTTGVNPFIVSGRRGISMGFDAASMNPRVAGLTKRYVGTMLANWFGSMTTIGALNAAFNNGNPLPNGVPIGHVKYGEKDGKPQTFDLLPFFGLGRARDVTGAGKLIEDMRAGHDLDTAIGDAFVKIVNAQVNSLSGPVTDFGWQAMTGKPVGFDQPRVSPVRAGGRGEQLASDTMAALSNLIQLARPVIESGKAMVGMENESGDALKRLGGYFTTKSGMTDKARDTAVDRRKRANLNELALDLRRRISFGEAGDDVDGWLDKQLSDEDIPPNERIRLKVAIRRWNERRK